MLSANDQKRIGIILPESVEWPQLNVLGQHYRKQDNHPRHTVGEGRFVVGVAGLPEVFVIEEVQRLRDIISAKAPPKSKKVKSNDDGDAESSSKS